MPIFLNPIERRVLRSGYGPTPLMDVWGAVAFRVVHAGVRLGVLDALDGQWRSARGLAKELSIDPRGLVLLLDALQSLGYVARRGGRYSATPVTRRWMVRGRRKSLAPAFRFHHAAMATLFDDLEEDLRRGGPDRPAQEWFRSHRDVERAHQDWVVAMAELSAAEVVRKTRVRPAARRLLDIGGGHATYATALLRRYPRLVGALVDSPNALEVGKQRIADEGMADRFTLHPSDISKGGFPGDNDVVLVANVVHSLSAEDNQRLMRRVARALRPGGRVVILDQFSNVSPSPLTTTVTRLLAITYFSMSGGQTHSLESVTQWLVDAGFRTVRHRRLLTAPGALVSARIPPEPRLLR